MSKKRPPNRRKHDILRQNAERKKRVINLLSLGGKLTVIGLLMWLALSLINKISVPGLNDPAPQEVKKEPVIDPTLNLDYNFYSLLPQEKIIELDDLSLSEKLSGHLYIQVASFRSKHRAESFRKRLARLKFTNPRTGVASNNNGKWFRVNIGPFPDIRHVQREQKKLRLNGIKKTVIKSTNR